MIEQFAEQAFWIGLLQIIIVNIVLSGDNAVVIALAARSLPKHQQKKAVFWGSGAAVVMRIVLTIFALALLTLPWLKLIGAALLLWIGVKLLVPEDGEEEIESSDNIVNAVKTILIADLVMSLDNVLGVAAAAKGNTTLLILGLAISIPLIIFGATMLLKIMERFPIIVTIGAGLLGWVAGDMAVTDTSIKEWITTNAEWLHYAGPAAGAAIVILVGKMIAARAPSSTGSVEDLAEASDQPTDSQTNRRTA